MSIDITYFYRIFIFFVRLGDTNYAANQAVEYHKMAYHTMGVEKAKSA